MYIVAGNCLTEHFTPNGSLASPNYPENYPHNLLCGWRVTVPSANVNFIVSNISVASEVNGCGHDGLYVSLFLV